MSATIFLIRHGETGIDARKQLPEDPLSSEGRAEVKELARVLKDQPIAGFYASPYQRALETAKILADGESVTVDNRLREIPLWSDPLDLLEDPKRLELTNILVGAQEGVGSVLASVEENYGEKTVALVCHGNIIRAILALTLKMNLETVVRFQTDTASLTILERATEGYHRLRLFNWKPVGPLHVPASL